MKKLIKTVIIMIVIIIGIVMVAYPIWLEESGTTISIKKGLVIQSVGAIIVLGIMFSAEKIKKKWIDKE